MPHLSTYTVDFITIGIKGRNLLYYMRRKEDIMQKSVYNRSKKGTIARLLGLSFLSAFIFSIAVAIRHMLETPMKLESSLPGEAHYYKWKHGYIFYRVLGESKAPPFLLLHSPGLAASSYEMRNIIVPLAQHYHVYVPDLLGFGISDHPAIDYSSETFIALCQDFLTDVVKQPATIVASRLSCNYAVMVAATTPHLCERLVLISPDNLDDWQSQASISPTGISKIFSGRALPILLQETPVQLLLYPILSTRFMLRSILGKLHSHINDIDFAYYYASTHQIGAEHAYLALLSGKLKQDVTQQLELIFQPTLVIWGAIGLNSSRYIESQHDISWMKSNTRLALLPDAGLAVHEDQPGSVTATILSWNEEGNVAVSAPENIIIEAYCAKCKMKRKMLSPVEVTSKDGRPAVRGTCEVCGSNLHRFGRIKQQTLT
jgi:pimeloyl-ACP methyl ester carboxylesterase